MSKHKWADLPREILELIGKRLETRIEVYRFRAICSSWRSVIPLSTNSISSLSPPLNLPPPLSVTAVLSPVFFYRLEDEARTASCLIKVTQSTSGEMKIMDPLSSQYSIRKNSLTPNKSICILSLRLVQLFKTYRLVYLHRPTLDVALKRFVLFGNSGIFMLNDAGALGYFRIHDQNWTHLGNEGTKYEDVVVYKGQYYVVDTLGTVFWIDSESMTLVQFSPPLFGLGHLKNLLVSDGELFVVDTYYEDEQLQRLVDDFQRVDMRIYKLDQEWGTWVDVRSLDDRLFFLAKEACFSLNSKDIPGCNRNCVYFSEPKRQDRYLTTEIKRCFARVFDIQDRRRMKTVDCFPSHRKLFDLLLNFPCTLSPPEFPVSLDSHRSMNTK